MRAGDIEEALGFGSTYEGLKLVGTILSAYRELVLAVPMRA